MRLLLWIFFSLAALTSCARITQPPAETLAAPAVKMTWLDRQAQLSQIKNFGIHGKIAVQSQQDSGSASVAWKERAGQYFISLAGPLGSHAMQLSGQPGQVTLQAEGKTYHAKSAEQLLAKQWGYQLPISNMKYWIRGLPVPGVPANTRFDMVNRLTSLKQQGFQINYTDYASYGNIDLPTRISLYSNTLRVKIVIYNWQII